MALLLPYFVAIEKENKMNHPTLSLVGREKWVTYDGAVVWHWDLSLTHVEEGGKVAMAILLPDLAPFWEGREGGSTPLPL